MVIAMTCLVALAVLVVIVYGFLGQREVWDLDQGVGRLSRLKKRRDRLLRRIKDLEVERDSGALSEEEFNGLRRMYKKEAIQVSKDLDRLRSSRFRQISSRVGEVAKKHQKQIEALVRERRSSTQFVAAATWVLLAFAAGSRAEAGVELKARFFDASASHPIVVDAYTKTGDLNELSDEKNRVPYAGGALKIELFEVGAGASDRGKPLREWIVTTDSDGRIALDTGLDGLPPDTMFVATAEINGVRTFTPFFRPGLQPITSMLYRPSGQSEPLVPHANVVYDYTRSGEQHALRIRVELSLRYRDPTMYIGKKNASGAREIVRIELPEDAVVVDNSGPQLDGGGWVLSADGRAAVIDTPIPGFFDSFGESYGAWRLTYDVPARQSFVQLLHFPFPFEKGRLAVSCVHEDMAIKSERLPEQPFVGPPPSGAPVHTSKSFDTFMLPMDLPAGERVPVQLTVDNAAIGQVSRGALRWVGGFVLAFLCAIFAGVLFGKKSPPAEVLYGDLSGEEILDRIVELDKTFEAKKIKERDYRYHRDVLVQLAAEEMGAAETVTEAAGGGAVLLPAETRKLVARIDDLREQPNAGEERARLLEQLVEALAREVKNR